MLGLLAPLLGALGTAKGITAAGSLVGGLASMKAAGRKDPTPAQNLLSQAEGATAASEKYGFNRLTMLQYGQTAGAVGGGGGGPSPLASIEMITGGLAGVADIVAGRSAQKAAQARFRSDLNTLAFDQTRSGVLASIPRYARAGFKTPSPLGGNTATVAVSNGGLRGGSNVPFARLGDPVDLAAGSAGGVAIPASRLDRGNGVFIEGVYVEPTSGWTSAGQAEEEWGEVGGSLYGLAKMSRDLWHNRQALIGQPRPGQTRGTPLNWQTSWANGSIMPPNWQGSTTPPPDKRTRLNNAAAGIRWPAGSPTFSLF